MMTKAIIVDDDPGIRITNKTLLEEYFPNITLVGEAESLDDAYRLIQATSPDLVLLDIEIKGGSGFQLLQKLKPYSFKVVFITAFNNHAIKAIKFNAIDYVLKPVNAVEFEQAIGSALELIEKDLETQERNELFLQQSIESKAPNKIILRTTDALHLVDVENILFAKSDNSYTTFFLQNGDAILVSRGISFYEDLLSDLHFFRPHQSFLVNLRHVNRIDKSDGGFVVLNSKHEIPVSTRRKKALMNFMERL